MPIPPRPRAPRGAALLLAASLPCALAACGGPGDELAGGPGGTPRTPTLDLSAGGPVSDAELGEYLVVMHCAAGGEDVGALTFALWPAAAPHGVRAFLRLVDEGRYDGLAFHRVLREFVLQGGCVHGNGTGYGPFGILPEEPSDDPAHGHHYGVLSFAQPPSMQFFVCVAESPPVWELDDQGVTALGRLVHGVQTLERLADAPVAENGQGERSAPLVPLTLVRAEVVRGPPPATEPIERPRRDLGGEPEFVGVEEIVITFLERGQEYGVTRNRREAQERAEEALGLIESGALAFENAAYEYGDIGVPTGGELLVRRLSNWGVVDEPRQRARLEATRQLKAYRDELRMLVAEGALRRAELGPLLQDKQVQMAELLRDAWVERREDLNEPALAAAAFAMALGEVRLVPYEPFDCPRGWVLLRRVE